MLIVGSPGVLSDFLLPGGLSAMLCVVARALAVVTDSSDLAEIVLRHNPQDLECCGLVHCDVIALTSVVGASVTSGDPVSSPFGRGCVAVDTGQPLTFLWRQ